MLTIKLETIDELNAITNRLMDIIYLLELIGDNEDLALMSNENDTFKYAVSARYFLCQELEKLYYNYVKTISSINKPIKVENM